MVKCKIFTYCNKVKPILCCFSLVNFIFFFVYIILSEHFLHKTKHDPLSSSIKLISRKYISQPAFENETFVEESHKKKKLFQINRKEENYDQNSKLIIHKSRPFQAHKKPKLDNYVNHLNHKNEKIVTPPKQYNKKSHCVERRNIVFVKTHKTAGTTVQNILFRYGLNRNLTFALPEETFFGYPNPFVSSLAQFKEFGPFNIICHHMRFEQEEVQRLVPDAYYISILREPGELFQSSFDFFYGITEEFQYVPHRDNNSAELWLDNAEQYCSSTSPGLYSYFARNHMIFDLGYNEDLENDETIANVIKKIDSIFDLMLITDHMDESLVLLSELLCCSLIEVASLRLNGRDIKNVDGERAKRISDKARRWNKADAALFDFFNQTLWRKVKAYGFKKMAEKIKQLHKATEKLKSKCLLSDDEVPYSDLKGVSWNNLYQPENVKVTGFQLKPGAENIEVCFRLVAPESILTDIITQHQRLKFKPV